MKRRGSTTAVIGVFFIAFLCAYQITLSSVSRSSSLTASTPTTVEEKNFTKSEKSLHVPSPPPQPEPVNAAEPISCDRRNRRYDLCHLNGATVVDPATSTFFVPYANPTTILEKVRPYPRKWEDNIMSHIKELTLMAGPSNDINCGCDVHHQAPVLAFSTGGYTGNLFHDFNDGLIPLFLTASSLFSNRNVIFAITNCRNWWLTKYSEVLARFTRFPVINLDNDTKIHCFPSATVGLISHDFMTINPTLLPHSETFLTFRSLLGAAYNHGQISRGLASPPPIARPRLVFTSRAGNIGRLIRNEADVAKTAEEIGFEVVMFKPTRYTSLSNAYSLINASHAMIGVHGAALTHMLFLRPGSVFLQVVPLGIDWLGEACFGHPAKAMGLKYMEYKTRVEESSLLEKYARDHLVIRDPTAVVKQSFSNATIYLKGQDVRLDLLRFEKYLRKAYKRAKRFMESEG